MKQQSATPPQPMSAWSDFVTRIPETLAFEYGALAVALDQNELTVAFDSPPSDIALERLERATGLRIRAVSGPLGHIRRQLARIYGATPSSSSDLEEHASAPPAVRAADALHSKALYERASDLHLEPSANGTRVRFRIDGSLREVAHFDPTVGPAIVSRLKVLAGMDIAERRAPQDGRYTVTLAGQTLDARVSSVPTQRGEKLVIRLLGRSASLPTLFGLGMNDAMRIAFSSAINLPCGFVVVCGPTGSGKTTTLYAALAHLNTISRNVCTVEDPVELALEGVTQIHVNGKAGVTFPGSLRAILRQDPDVIMIGECRDNETATTAIAAALSGQLVFTTLHSADAPRTVDRFVELGVSRSSLAAGLSAILSQRLVRRLCANCRQTRRLSPEAAAQVGLQPEASYSEASGCALCRGTGYHERVGIFELLVVDDTLRDAIARGVSSVVLERLARNRGYRTMAEDCRDKCLVGLTSPEELARVSTFSPGV